MIGRHSVVADRLNGMFYMSFPNCSGDGQTVYLDDDGVEAVRLALISEDYPGEVEHSGYRAVYCADIPYLTIGNAYMTFSTPLAVGDEERILRAISGKQEEAAHR
jgi:hypothetical protein